jgi:hypothetical protein
MIPLYESWRVTSCAATLPTLPTVAAATAPSANGDRGVIGPSTDGRYYLLGLKRGIGMYSRTSTGAPTASSSRRSSGCARSVLPSWYGVDDSASLRLLAQELLESRPFKVVGPQPAMAPHCRPALALPLHVRELASSFDRSLEPMRVA